LRVEKNRVVDADTVDVQGDDDIQVNEDEMFEGNRMFSSEEEKIDDWQPKIEEFKESQVFRDFKINHSNSLYAQQLEHSDEIIVKFLKDSNFVVKKALKNFKNMIEWRDNNDVDQALTWKFNTDVIKQFYPHQFNGFDKEGRPVYIERLGNLQLKELMGVINLEDYTKYHILHWEFVHRVLFPIASARAGRRINQLVTLVDVEGLNTSILSTTAIEFLRRIAKIDQEMYPESSHRLYIVNVPWLFKAVWKIIRPWLNARGRDKVHIIRGDPKECLTKAIDDKQLLDFLGGTRSWDDSVEDKLWCDLCKGVISEEDLVLPNN